MITGQPSAGGAENPYIGLRPFLEKHQERFFGRDNEIHILTDKILANRLTLLVAASGVGKSSLLQAGVMPALRNGGMGNLVYHNDWALQPARDLKQSIVAHLIRRQRIDADYQADLDQPLDEFLRLHSLLAGEGTLVVLLDQFEEFFYYQRFSAQRQRFIQELAASIRDTAAPTAFVFSMREDFAMELTAFKPWLKTVFDNVYRIEKLTLAAAEEAIVRPAAALDYSYEPELLGRLKTDLGKRERLERLGIDKNHLQTDAPLLVEPPHLQIVCRELWQYASNDKPTYPVPDGKKLIRYSHYAALGFAAGILERYFKDKMATLTQEQLRLASKAFDHLVSEHGAKMAYPLDELAKLLDENEQPLKATLDELQNAAILRRVQRQEKPWYELHHDIFAKSIAAWNREYKYRQMLRGLKLGGVYTVLGAAALLLTFSFWNNHSHRFLGLGPDTVSDRVELWRGSPGSWDIFRQQEFLFETDFERRDMEADKRFEKMAVADLNLERELVAGLLPLNQRFLQYAEDGLYQKTESVAEVLQDSHDDNLLREFIRQLPAKRVEGIVDLLNKLSLKSPDFNSDILRSFLQFTKRVCVPILKERIGDDGVREVVTDHLGYMQAESAIPILIEMLSDNDSSLRKSAVNALGQIKAESAIPKLIEKLSDNDSGVREAAAEILGDMQAESAIPKLIEKLSDDSFSVKNAAIDSLIYMRDMRAENIIVPMLIEELDNDDRNVRTSSARNLGKLKAKTAIPKLIEKLRDNDSGVRQAAAEILGDMHAESAIPKLIENLNDDNRNVRMAAAHALGKLRAETAVPWLIERLGKNLSDFLIDHFNDRKDRAAKALDEILAPIAIPKFIELLADDNFYGGNSDDDKFNSDKFEAYLAAIHTLGYLRAEAAVPLLIEKLDHRYYSICIAAVGALGDIKAESAVPKLFEMLNDDYRDIRLAAVYALGKIKAEPTVPKLFEMLNDNDDSVRRTAVDALGMIKAEPAVPKLFEMLNDDYRDIRQAAADALGNMQTESADFQLIEERNFEFKTGRLAAAQAVGDIVRAKFAIPKLIGTLDSRRLDIDIRLAAISVLGKMQAEITIPRLLKLFASDDSEEIRQAASVALSRMPIPPAELTQWQEGELIRLESAPENTYDRTAYAAALGRIYRREAVERLAALLNDGNIAVVKNAIKALGDIGAYHPQWLKDKIQQLIPFTVHTEPALRETAIIALGQLLSFSGNVKAEELGSFEDSLLQHLAAIAEDPSQKLYLRRAAIDELGATNRPQSAALLLALWKGMAYGDLHTTITYWLGKMRYAPAKEALQAKLAELEQDKRIWRVWRERHYASAPQSLDIDAMPMFDKNNQNKSWQNEHLGYRIAHAIAQIDPQNDGIALLDHPLYAIRQGAIFAIAGRADGKLIKEILKYHQDFDPGDLPSPRPYAAYRTLDLALLHIEFTGNQEDLEILKEIKGKGITTQMKSQQRAINERFDWTIAELGYRLQSAGN